MFEASLVYVAKSPAMATQRPHLEHTPKKQKVEIELNREEIFRNGLM